MSPLPWSLRLLDLAAGESAAALELLLQSTLIIALGLAAAWLLRGRGSALRSAIYRATLVAVVACPAATWLISALGLSAAIDWLPSLRPMVVELVQPASDPADIGRTEVAVQNEALSDATAQPSGAPPRQDDPFSSSRVGEPFGNSPRFSEVPFDDAPGVRRKSNGDRRAEPPRQDSIVAVKAVPARPAGPAWVVNPAAAALAVGIAAFWLLGSSVLFLRLLIDHWRVVGICRTASPADADDRLLCDEFAAKLGIQAPRLLQSPYLSGPCLTGLWRHTILLPEESSDVPLSSVLIHELAHLRRGDSGWNLLRHAVRVVLFFQPLLWCLSRRMEEAAEEVCDDHVVHWGADRSVYADGLVRLAEQRSLPLSTVVPLVRFRSLLGRRVQRILDRSHRLSLRAGMKALCAIAAAGLAVTLVVALVAPSGRSVAAPVPSEAKKSDAGAEKKSADTAKAAETPNVAKRISGTVLLPSGKPAAGAHVVLIGQLRQATRFCDFDSPRVRLLAHAQCNAMGRFELAAADLSSQRYLWVQLLARSADSGLAWREVNADEPRASASIKLPEAAATRGRLLTLEGRPAGGVRVTVLSVTRSGARGSGLDDGVYVDDMAPAEVWPTGVISDPDGWFTVPGIAGDVELGLYIHQEPFAAERLTFERTPTDTSRHVFALSPAQIVKGVIVAADTGKPLENAAIRVNQNWEEDANRGMMAVEGKTDAEGRFRLNPYAAKAYTVTAIGAKGTPYLATQLEIKWSETEREHELRLELPRGVLVHGTALEEPGGRPVANATVRYSANWKNPHAKNIPLEGIYQPTELSDEQGHFTIAVPAGKGHLTVKSSTGEHVLKELDERQIGEGRPGGARWYVNADAAIDLTDDAREHTVDFKLQRGVTVKGELVRTDGRTPERVIMIHRGTTGNFDDEFRDDPTTLGGNRFEIRGVPPDGEFPAFFLDPDAKQGKRLPIRSSDAGKPLRVTLEPCGSLSLRFLDPDGKPVAGHIPSLMIVFTPGKPSNDLLNKSNMPRADETFIANFDRVNCWDSRTDEDGRVTYPSLIPGVMYRLLEISDKGQEERPWKYREITVKPGERLELPDIVIRNPDVLRYVEDERMKQQKEQAMKAATPSAANSGESPKQMPTGTTSAVQAPTVERAMSNVAAQITQSAPPPSEAKKSDEGADKKSVDTATAADTPNNAKRLSGTVLLPSGKPAAGAHAVLIGRLREESRTLDFAAERPIVLDQKQCDGAGRFELSATGLSSQRYLWVQLLVRSAESGLAWRQVNPDSADASISIKLPEAAPARGRLITLEGRPAAGVRVRVIAVAHSGKGKYHDLERIDTLGAPLPTEIWPSGVVADSDGWFAIPGVAVDTALILETDQEPFAPEGWRFDPAATESDRVQTLAPAQIIKGVVVAADTGKPLPNALIHADQNWGPEFRAMIAVEAKTDAVGRFRVNPYIATGYTVTAFGPNGTPYLAKGVVFKWNTIEREHELLIELQPGVLIGGEVVEEPGGRPVANASVRYRVMRDNPHAKGVSLEGMKEPTELTDKQGRFTMAVPAGKGHLTVKSADGEHVLKELDESVISQGHPGGKRLYVNDDTALDLPDDAREFAVRFHLHRGVAVKGEIVRSDGRPAQQLLMAHRGVPGWNDQFRESPTMLIGNRFEIRGVPPDGEFPAFFLDPDSKEGKLLPVHGSDSGKPLRVTLEPCGSFTVRFLDPEGKPIAGHSPLLMITFAPGGSSIVPARSAGSPLADEAQIARFGSVSASDAMSGEDGRITFPALIPGAMYRLWTLDEKGINLEHQITVKPGEHLELPDLVIRDTRTLRSAEEQWLMKQKEQAAKTSSAPPTAARAESPAQMPADDARESPKQMPTGTTSAVQAPNVETAMSNAAANAADTPFHYRGQVVDPNGKPVAGAKLFLVYWTHGATAGETAKPRAVSDAQGSFEFIVKRSEYEADGNEGLSSQLFAVGTGFGFAAASSVDFETSGELLKQLPLATRLYLAARAGGHKPVLRLALDDVPIIGRVLTIEGHPVAGARVRVKELSFNDQGSLDSWERAAKEPKADYYSLRNHAPDTLNGPQLAAAIPDAVADADGRFTLAGIGRERIVQMLISGPGIETREVTARTRKAEKVVVPEEWSSETEMKREGVEFQAVYYGASFVHVAGPSKPVEGRVTDADTGKPLAGIRVSAGMNWTFARMGKPYIAATTGADGKYRLEGLPVGKDETIYVVPPGDTAYLPAGESVTVQLDGADKPHDFRLKLGIWVRGKFVDDRTGEPVPGAVRFFAYQDNSHLKAYPGFSGAWGYERRADRAGRFQIAVIPGPGVIAFMADEHSRFRRGLGAETLTGRFTGAGKDLMDRMFRTCPGILSPGDEELVREIAPVPGSKPLDLTLALTSGIDVVGRLLDPVGRPLSGGIASGEVFEGAWYPIQGETFRVEGYYPDRPRELFFFHQERNLAGHYLLKGQPPKDLAIRLEPAGAIRGRLLDVHGAPLPGIRLRGTGVPDDNSGDARLRLSTDDAGRFEIRGLISGRKYTVDGDGDGTSGRVLVDRTVEAGKTVDVGDVTIQPPDSTKTLQSPPAPTTTESDPKDAIKSKADTAAESASASGNKSTQSDRKAADDLLSVNGRVLDPQGKPVAAVEVLAIQQYWKTWRHVAPLVSTKSGEAGRFHLQFRMSQVVASAVSPSRFVSIVAKPTDPKLGIAWVGFDAIKPGEETTLQLVPDEPIEGKIVDLEGRPAAGVEVKVIWLATNAKSDLTTWLGALKTGIPEFGSRDFEPPDRGLPTEFTDQWKTKTGADGRFRFSGLGHDRHTTLIVSSSATVTAELRAITRRMEPITVDATNTSSIPRSMIYYGSQFQYAVEPSQPIEGIARDAETGQPLAGVQVVSEMFAGQRSIAVFGEYPYPVRSVSDENGHYRLDGMPRGEGNRILAMPTDGQPYFIRSIDVPTAPGFEPVKFDLELHRGVLIQGRVTDKITGEPVEGADLRFVPWPDNPRFKALPEFNGGRVLGGQDRYRTDHDGRYQLVGLPGRGLVELELGSGSFPHGQGLREIADLPDRRQFWKFGFYPIPGVSPAAVKELSVREQDDHVVADFALDPGKRVTLNIVDPDDKPLSGVEVQGLLPKQQSFPQANVGPSVEVKALWPDEQRLVLLYQKERNLGKAIRICWNDAGPGPVTVKLEPCATLKARLLDKNGDPVRAGSLRFDADSGDFGLKLPDGATDRDGRLNYRLLLPGGKYNVYCDCRQTAFQNVIKNLTVSPGEIVDLGEFDVTSKNHPKPKRTNAISSEIEPKTPVPADGKGEMKTPAAAGRDHSAQSDRKADDDLFSVNGRVLDPAGKPAAGADVEIVQSCRSVWKKAATLVAGKTDDAGRFRLEFRKSELAAAGFEPRNPAALVASMPGFGAAWCDCDPTKSDQQTSLQLVADEPVEGRIVDLEGRPVAGVKAEVVSLTTNRKNDLRAWLASLKSGVPTFVIGDEPLLDAGDGEKPDRYLRANPNAQWKSTTDNDGRFRIAGLGHDRVARIELTGSSIALAELTVVTRPIESLKVLSAGASLEKRPTVYYGSHFQYAAEPSQPVEGVVRNAQTGKGLARVAVAANALAGEFHKVIGSLTTTSDESGHYRLVGMPKGPGNRILAIPADGEPYFAREFDVPAAKGFEPVKLDLELHRGVLVRGRVTDQVTGAPVSGAHMSSVPWPDNPNANGMVEFSQGAGLWNRYLTDPDGQYALVGLPGRGLVLVEDPSRPYPSGQGFREIPDLPGLSEFMKWTVRPIAEYTTAIKKTRIGPDDREIRVDFELSPGKRLTLKLVDPEGQPITGVEVQGLWPKGQHLSQSNMGPTMDVEGLLPDERRLVLLQQKNRNLGKAIRVSWKENGPSPMTIKLEPCGALKARLLDKHGDPVHNGVIRVSIYWGKDGSPSDGTLSDYDATDSDGHMNCKGLLPGADYFVLCDSPQLAPNTTEWVIDNLFVSPGETIDLGEFDVTSKDRPKPKRTSANPSLAPSTSMMPASDKN